MGPWLSLPSRSSEGSLTEFQARGDSAGEAGVWKEGSAPWPAVLSPRVQQRAVSRVRVCKQRLLGVGSGAETLGNTPTWRPREETSLHPTFPTSSCSPPKSTGSRG